MTKYILIAVIGWSMSQGGVGSFSAEFDSLESCAAAVRIIKDSVRENNFASVVSIECHAK